MFISVCVSMFFKLFCYCESVEYFFVNVLNPEIGIANWFPYLLQSSRKVGWLVAANVMFKKYKLKPRITFI